ncbi:hypothetical protein GLOTRDRAFT_71371 [Gloeophyllum trabeum ATCC 11539]|uniref:Chromatin target of PRMT1 protein C-terminal domain-containing protein n=1 Tax=Gloeophyllum trabeum (strain ATCC 11539 / FP-39264 / Madison 617) TaxID=670483 RepID=S7RXP9_GLOTA|nr:uncharacterized protein GLOTRDRAFT_71371 [Gloeophyllum trabeum ATCC 11539]EPQ59710.1 hypothetical protein GLOTRDRAFT_71371 [Gloeophyllum trabeum ATCC 11539]
MAPDAAPLSYDDAVAYEDQLSTTATVASETAIMADETPGAPSLANRIGQTKVYLLADASLSKAGKTYRPNAVLLHGPPIAHLPTSNLFAYATHFDSHPMGLEWIDDTTCVLVFESRAAARLAHRALSKSPTEAPDEAGFVAAKPIPVALWPAEDRISKVLGKGEGLKGAIRMRWARRDDVKKRGAKRESEFYRKHGARAGKEGFVPPEELERESAPKRRRKDEEQLRAELDQDIDSFLAEDEEEPPAPPSKMRSDNMGVGSRKSLLERTSVMRVRDSPSPSLADRITKPMPRRREKRDREWDRGKERASPARRRSGERARSERRERPKKTQQELDDELDAFLNEGR